MANHMIRAGIIASTLLAAMPAARAQTLYLQENLPYTASDAGDPGFMLKIVHEMTRILHLAVPEKFSSWADAQKAVREGQDGLIFPFARLAEREPNYAWVVKFWDMDETFYAAPGSAVPATLAAAAALPSVGVGAGTSQETYLKAQGLTNLHPYQNAKAVARAVAAGEVSAGYGPLIETKYAWITQDLPGKAKYGPVITTATHWIAASKNSPHINPEDWRQAFEVLQQDGTFDRLYADYFGPRYQ